MTDYGALGIGGAGAGARVQTFLVDASFLTRALCVNDAFGATRGWGSHIAREARASGRAPAGRAL